MQQLRRILFMSVVGLSLALSSSWAQDIRIRPIPPRVQPQWVQVPGVPEVYYATNIPTDVFRYRGKYYFYWENYVYRGKSPKGPWKSLKTVPPWFYQIDPAYLKTAKKNPPGGQGTAPGPYLPPQSLPPTQSVPPAIPQPPLPPPAGEPEQEVKPGL
jgi:hypothetical protein